MRGIAEVVRDHILMVDQFTYISTFAGCGGSSLGYKWAGGKGLLAIEFDANAAATYRANFETPVLERDICTVTAAEVLKLTGLRVGELDVLDGSPPCQGFSTAGKRQIHDPRNSLFREFVRLIEGLQPKVFVMENVSGLVKGKMKYVFAEIMRCLKATGYAVRCKLLNAMYFNVPQSRERLIWIGVRADIGRGPEFPKAQGKPTGFALEQAGDGPWWLNKEQVAQRIEHRSRQEARGHGWGHVFYDGEGPCPTVPKNGFCSASPILVKQSGGWRHLVLGELKSAGSYPSSWAFVGTWQNAYQRIGNSVPPRFMQAIAETIRDAIILPARAARHPVPGAS